jgi:hypothetical protein
MEDIVAVLKDDAKVERFTAAQQFLRQHLIHRRDILNGKDFLFAGGSAEVHQALKTLVAIEHEASRFLQFDYVQIDEYFLLRVVAEALYQDMIDTYFD